MRYSADRKKETRARILAEAARALRTVGPERLGVAEVMAKAGLTHGGFYAHFASKAALVTASLEAMFAEGARAFGRRSVEEDAGRVLARFIDGYLSREHRDRRDLGCPLSYLAGDAARLEDAARESYAAGMARLRTRLAAELAGDEQAAASLLAEAVGALALARAEPNADRSDAILSASRDALKRRFTGERHD